MQTLTYNEAKRLFSQILPPADSSFFERMADVFSPVQVQMDTLIRFRFATKYGNEVDYETDTAESEQRIINIVKGCRKELTQQTIPFTETEVKHFKRSKYVDWKD